MSALWIWLTTLAGDIRFGSRMIARKPLLSCAVVATLVFGIGLTTTVFSTVNAFVFTPWVAHDPESFVSVHVPGEDFGSEVTLPQYLALRDQSKVLRELAAWSNVPLASHLGSDNPEYVEGLLVSCNFFSVFGNAPPLAGRLLQPDDCATLQPVVVISDQLWRTQFGADPAIIGKSLLYGGQPVTVIGVSLEPIMEMGIRGQTTDAWFPLTMQSQLNKTLYFPLEKGRPWLNLAGRLQPGYSREAANTEFQAISSRLCDVADTCSDVDAQEPRRLARLNLTDGSPFALGLFPLWQVSLVMVLPTLIMLLACVNVAALLLSRAASRRNEMAIRLALGTSRWRLIRMLLVETFMLAAVAAMLTLLLVSRLTPVLIRYLPIGANAPAFPLAPDWRVFAWLAVVTIVATVCSGLTPALESLNLKLTESLKGLQRTFAGYRRASRMRGVLIGLQVAFSMGPLVGAATCARQQLKLSNPGFDTRNVIGISLPKDQIDGTPQRLAADIAALPGAKSVAYTKEMPMYLADMEQVQIPGRAAEYVYQQSISSGYFDAMDMAIMAGRGFRDDDAHGNAAEEPVVVSQQFAHRFFPNVDPIGQTLQQTGKSERLKIVGVAPQTYSDYVVVGRTVDFESLVYRLMPEPAPESYLLVRFDGDIRAFAPSLQALLRRSFGTPLPVETLYESFFKGRIRLQWQYEKLLLSLGAIALVLAIVGVFGVTSFATSQRRKEVAIRLALGAGKSDIYARILIAGLRSILIGTAAGILLSWGMLKLALLQRMLPPNLVPLDPIPFAAACFVLLLAAVAAMLIPARRVALRHPADSLREE